MLEIIPLPALADNYIWLMRAGNDKRVAVVDPGEAAPVRDYLEQHSLEIGAILITHHHPDHTGGVSELMRGATAAIYGPAEATGSVDLSEQVGEGESVSLDWLGVTFDVISVPGHTAGHIAYHGGGMVFSGDTLFRGGCGRLFEGDAAQMRASLAKLRDLPADTRIYCGHEYTEKNLRFAAEVEPDNAAVGEALAGAQRARAAGAPTLPSTISEERAINPFLRWDDATVAAAAKQRAGRELADADEVLATIRQWKDAS